MNKTVFFVAGPTASGKTKEAIRLAKLHDGEVVSVDSRQVYRGLDIGTEKISPEEMEGIPHHLIDVCGVTEKFSAGDFVARASALIEDIFSRGKTPILAGGTHFYFDALLYGLPEVEPDDALRATLETFSNEELLEKVRTMDPERGAKLDPANRRRLIRALEIIQTHGRVPVRAVALRAPFNTELNPNAYHIEWIIIDPPKEELRARIDARLKEALNRGLIDEVRRVREQVGDERLNEFGLEYRIVGEYLRGERTEASLFPALSSKLWHYARRQKAWLRKLKTEFETNSEATEASPLLDRN